jgi:hypothetical protein
VGSPGGWQGRCPPRGPPNISSSRLAGARRDERHGNDTGERLNIAVRLRVVKSHGGAAGQRAPRDAAHVDNAATGVRGGVARRPVLGSWGRAAGAVCAVGPPNISSSRPPELAVASVTGSRPAAAEQGR